MVDLRKRCDRLDAIARHVTAGVERQTGAEGSGLLRTVLHVRVSMRMCMDVGSRARACTCRRYGSQFQPLARLSRVSARETGAPVKVAVAGLESLILYAELGVSSASEPYHPKPL